MAYEPRLFTTYEPRLYWGWGVVFNILKYMPYNMGLYGAIPF